MSFREKSTGILLLATLGAIVAYVVLLVQASAGVAVDEIAYAPLVFVAVVAMVILTVAGHIAVAAAAPKEADEALDERDRIIEMRGDQIASWILSAGVAIGILLAMIEVHWFWIANVLLGAFAWSGVMKWSVMLLRYRRGF